MKKALMLLIKAPIFLIRSVNAAIMRLPIAYLVVVAIYCVLFYAFKDGIWSAQSEIPIFLGFASVVSLVWGLVYTLSKPPITKKVYTSASAKFWAVIARVFGAIMFAFLYIYINQNKLARSISVFGAVQMLINAIILMACAKVPAKVYRKQRTTTPTPTPTVHHTSMSGQEGEEEVDYNLKWLTADGYIAIEKVLNELDEKKEIRLRCRKVLDETQEFDHIVIGPNGVFNIETKTYKGTIFFNERGEWCRYDRVGNKINEKNPIAQIDRHHTVLKGILGDEFPIIDILCIAHPDAEIKASNNAPLPIIKADMLTHFIKNYSSQNQLMSENIQKAKELIEKSRVRVYNYEKEDTV